MACSADPASDIHVACIVEDKGWETINLLQIKEGEGEDLVSPTVIRTALCLLYSRGK